MLLNKFLKIFKESLGLENGGQKNFYSPTLVVNFMGDDFMNFAENKKAFRIDGYIFNEIPVDKESSEKKFNVSKIENGEEFIKFIAIYYPETGVEGVRERIKKNTLSLYFINPMKYINSERKNNFLEDYEYILGLPSKYEFFHQLNVFFEKQSKVVNLRQLVLEASNHQIKDPVDRMEFDIYKYTKVPENLINELSKAEDKEINDIKNQNIFQNPRVGGDINQETEAKNKSNIKIGPFQ